MGKAQKNGKKMGKMGKKWEKWEKKWDTFAVPSRNTLLQGSPHFVFEGRYSIHLFQILISIEHININRGVFF